MYPLRANALKIFKAALAASDPFQAVKRRVSLKDNCLILNTDGKTKTFPVSRFRKIYVLGAGKAALPMALAVKEILGKRIDRGLIITKYGHGRPLEGIQVIEAGHPIPDTKGHQGAREILNLAKEAHKNDLIIFLTSGGCSALLPLPASPVTLSEKQKLTGLLIRSGAAIQEINAVRKHLSLVKGGRLAEAAFPATVINLVLSDVIGDTLDVIGSGPFATDPATFQDAWNVLEQYHIIEKVPRRIIAYLSDRKSVV